MARHMARAKGLDHQPSKNWWDGLKRRFPQMREMTEKKGTIGKRYCKATYKKGQDLFEVQMERAMREVESGMPLRTAARKFGLSHSTLKNRVHRNNLIKGGGLVQEASSEAEPYHGELEDCEEPGNLEIVGQYYADLENVLSELGITDRMNHIWHMEEVGIFLDDSTPKVFTHFTNACSDISVSPAMTMMNVVCASGQALTPYLVARGETVHPVNAVSEDGWANGDIFTDFFTNFIKHVPTPRPIILFINGHTPYYSVELAEAAQSEGVFLHVSPLHSSADVFEPFKTQLQCQLDKWVSDNPLKLMQPDDLPVVFSEAWDVSMTFTSICFGFVKSGLCPLKGSEEDSVTSDSEESSEKSFFVCITPTPSSSQKTNCHKENETKSSLTLTFGEPMTSNLDISVEQADTHMTTPNTNDNFDTLTRKDQATIFCLRTQHIPLNSHLNRIGATVGKACPLCNHPEETVEHHLFYCTKLKDLRERFLPSQPDTQNTIFGTVSQLKNTCHFHYNYVTEPKGKSPRAAGSLRRRRRRRRRREHRIFRSVIAHNHT